MKTVPSYSRRRLPATLMSLTLLWTALAAAQVTSAAPKASSASVIAAYPLKISPSHRYLVDQNDMPFLIVGDSPQGLMSRLSEEEADSYFADRQARGFNTMGWIDVTCAGHDFPNNKEGSTFDGIKPSPDMFLAGQITPTTISESLMTHTSPVLTTSSR